MGGDRTINLARTGPLAAHRLPSTREYQCILHPGHRRPETFTGILLMFYYIPDGKEAFQSIEFTMNHVPYGWLFRLMHVMGAVLRGGGGPAPYELSIFLGSYKEPRELTWVVGALLLLTVLGFTLSGYLLPWSQLSFWATTVVTDIPTAFPLVGGLISKILRGSENVLGVTLNRFFALHVAFFPSCSRPSSPCTSSW